MATIRQRLFPARAVRLFRRRLSRLASARRLAGRSFFPAGPEGGEDSYFIARSRTVQRAQDFDALGCGTPDEFAERLAERWRAEGNDDLAALAGDFARLAETLRASEEPEEQEVSPFVYVMY